MKNPLITVVIPVFNGLGYISRSVESVLAQEDVVKELIVVDDGSTDGTGDLIANQYPDVRLIRQPNAGQAVARNRGVNESKGQYIAFLDSDDWWSTRKLYRQLSIMLREPQLSYCFTDFRGVDGTGANLGWQGGLGEELQRRGVDLRSLGENEYIITSGALDALVSHTSYIHPSSLMVRKDFFEKLGGFDASYCPAEDLEFWIRMSPKGWGAFIDETLVTVVGRPGSQGRQTTRMADALVLLYSGLTSKYPELSEGARSHIDRFLLEKHLYLAWALRRDRNMVKSRVHYRAALAKRFQLRTFLGLIRTYL